MSSAKLDIFDKICYILYGTPRLAVAPHYEEVMTMVTYEGIFMFITTLTCVVTLVLDIIDRRKK